MAEFEFEMYVHQNFPFKKSSLFHLESEMKAVLIIVLFSSENETCIACSYSLPSGEACRRRHPGL